MITLPARPDRNWLRSFSVAFALGAGLVTIALAQVLGTRQPLRLAVAVTLVIAVPGLLRPLLMYKIYRGWNRLARGYARVARHLLLRVCYYTVFALVARAGSALRVERPAPGTSLWTPRSTLPPATYTSQDASPAASKDGLAGVLLWSIRSGQLWAIFLVPFLALLRMLEAEAKGGPPADIYTLY
mgnify:CR=1 FL=1|jgi:hypothetical protein